MSIYINKIKHKLWESYIYNPPLRYSYFKFCAKSEHTFNKINENNKKKIIEFEQILLMTGDSFDYELMLSKKRPYVIVGAFVIGMLLTPPDVISQTLLAVPIWLLFELGIVFSKIITKKKNSIIKDKIHDDISNDT